MCGLSVESGYIKFKRYAFFWHMYAISHRDAHMYMTSYTQMWITRDCMGRFGSSRACSDRKDVQQVTKSQIWTFNRKRVSQIFFPAWAVKLSAKCQLWGRFFYKNDYTLADFNHKGLVGFRSTRCICWTKSKVDLHRKWRPWTPKTSWQARFSDLASHHQTLFLRTRHVSAWNH